MKQSRKSRLTDEEYEDTYREALLCLSETLAVGKPHLNWDGIRVCSVDGVVLDDGQVLERWWGTEIARYIQRQQRRNGPQLAVPSNFR